MLPELQPFTFYINDFDEGTKRKTAKLADDVKIGRRVLHAMVMRRL